MKSICSNVLKRRKVEAIEKGELDPENKQVTENFNKLFSIKPFGFHAIRHLSATVQYQSGKELNWLQRFFKHFQTQECNDN